MNDQRAHLNFLEQFIARHYSEQPPWVRTLVFLALVCVLVFAFYRIIGGEFSVYGVLHQKVEGGSKKAPGYDLMLGKDRFGTNYLGEYYIILSPLRYLTLMADGKLTVSIWKDDYRLRNWPLNFDRLSRQFELTVFDPPQEGGVPARQSRLHGYSASAVSLSDLLVRSAQADPVQGGDRLFVEAVQLKSDLPSIKEGALELQVNKDVLKLRSTRTREGAAGFIPLASGAKFFLGTDYYFEIPGGFLPSPPSVQIKLSAKSGFFSSYSETFQVSLSQNYADRFPVTGNQGSQISLLLLKPYDVVIYEKKDLLEVKDKLKDEFFQGGFRAIEFRSPLGYTGQTNALFGGKKVSFKALQSILNIVSKHGIKIKTVQYQLDLRSGNPYEIQLGGSAAFNDRPPIPESKLTELKNAPTEEEFRSVLAH